MSGPLIVLTGAAGFVGSAVLRRLSARHPDAVVRVVSRRPLPPDVHRGPWVRADLAEPESLRGVCEGADVVLSLASYVGPDAGRCEAVNVAGTAALVAEAGRAGVGGVGGAGGGVRVGAGVGVGGIVQLSTCAVYGAGPHRGQDVGELIPAPVSAASRSRLAGERAVLDAGGLVLRAGLVLGPGDRWAVPALVDAFRRVPRRWGGGAGRASFVDVDDLARLVVGLAVGEGAGAWAVAGGGVLHAHHPEPVRNRDLMEALGRYGVLPGGPAGWPAGGDLAWGACLEALAAAPGWVSERQFTLLAGDSWYRADTAWRLAGVDPGPGPLARLERAVDWYRGRGGMPPG
ncbi:NAD(P)-dependent oxidoreductase [Streptomyces sp. NPDC047014]|uniref:NAD-dependent epimerase/dehydratase family protein n=1 Tax=Streptomyces sp. NPDC047014 TaxID=3155736 RepID=UPI0033DBE01F